MTATMTVKLLSFLHLLGMALWLGGTAVLGMWTGRARRSGDAKLIAFGYAAAARLYRGVVAGAAMLSLLSGVGLTLATQRPWFRPFPEHWLFQMQIVGFAAFLVTLIFLVPNAGALARLAERPEDPEFATRVRRQVIVGNLVGLALIYLVILGSFRF